MSDITGQPAELHMTVQITRKATGATETYQLIGRTTVEQAKAAGIPEQEQPNGNDTQHGGA
jgi:hypothetical protein